MPISKEELVAIKARAERRSLEDVEHILDYDMPRLVAEVERLHELLREVYIRLTDIEQYGEHRDNPLPSKIRKELGE